MAPNSNLALQERLLRHLRAHPIESRTALAPSFSDQRHAALETALQTLINDHKVTYTLVPQGSGSNFVRVYFLTEVAADVTALLRKLNPTLKEGT